eukprot:gene12142-15250_t
MSSTASSTLSEQQVSAASLTLSLVLRNGIVSPSQRAAYAPHVDQHVPDGSIATKDLVTAIRSLGKDTTDVSHDGVHYDAANDANQTIDFSEFLSLMITELRSVLVTLGQNLSVEEAEEIIREADIDGDGHVNFADFAAMMSKSFRSCFDPRAIDHAVILLSSQSFRSCFDPRAIDHAAILLSFQSSGSCFLSK